MIDLYKNGIKLAVFKENERDFLMDYQNFELKNSITLSLPNSQKFYNWTNNFPPYFETFIPEGYLYEVFKNILTKKHGYIDDYLMFSFLAPNISSRITYRSEYKELNFAPIDIDEILNNDTDDTFRKLLKTFLDKNAISGVQPKTFAIVQDKESFSIKDYIIKTWGLEFPYLAENEYFSMKAVEKAGVWIPNIELSKNKKFLLVESFIHQGKEIMGFEEVLSLMNKNKINKYQGSYEQVSKVIMQFSTNKTESMQQFFKTIVMNYLLKNGDAHLKNFGLLFNDDFTNIKFAPAYDIVTTTPYIIDDPPALTLAGRKIWHKKDALINFGRTHCLLSKNDAENFFQECLEALKESIGELKNYIEQTPHFETVGSQMLEAWQSSVNNT